MEEDIEYIQSEIMDRERDIAEWEASLRKYIRELTKEQQKSRDIPALVEFLNRWKESVSSFYRMERVSDERKELNAMCNEKYREYSEFTRNAWRDPVWKERSYSDRRTEERRLFNIYNEFKEAYDSRFGQIEMWESRGDFEEEMEKDLQKDWVSRYDRLVSDVTDKVGVIRDCTGLSVSGRGELNGIVIGDKGRAQITTFLAGGYNIQCLHYRCKITKLKDR